MAMTPEEKAAKEKIYQAKYRAAHRAEEREYRRAWAAANPDKIVEYRRRYTAAHGDKRRESSRRWALAHPDKVLAYARKWVAAHPEKIAAAAARRSAAQKEARITTMRPPLGEVLGRQLARNDIYSAAAHAVTCRLPRDVRDDVIADIIVAVLAGELPEQDIAANAKLYISQYYGQADRHRTLSLNAPVPGTDDLSFLDCIPSDADHF